MQRRRAWLVLALILASGGGYALAWLAETRHELTRLGARIPSPWLLAAWPVGPLYFAWCWAEGVGLASGRRTSATAAFLAVVLLGPVGIALLQREFNRLSYRAETRRARSLVGGGLAWRRGRRWS
jgi:hypothetical protein